jgi:hypothetical protein
LGVGGVRKGGSSGSHVDLYEVEVDLYFKESATVLNRVQKHGVIKEERYVWGRDGKNRPSRKKLFLSIVIPRENVSVFKMRLTKLDQSLNSTIKYRKISTLV